MGNAQTGGLRRHDSTDQISISAASHWSTQTAGIDAIQLGVAVPSGDTAFPYVPVLSRAECVAILSPSPAGSYILFADGRGRTYIAIRQRDVLLRVLVVHGEGGYRVQPAPDSENAITDANQPLFARLVDLLLYYATWRAGVSFRLALPLFDLSALQDDAGPPVVAPEPGTAGATAPPRPPKTVAAPAASTAAARAAANDGSSAAPPSASALAVPDAPAQRNIGAIDEDAEGTFDNPLAVNPNRRRRSSEKRPSQKPIFIPDLRSPAAQPDVDAAATRLKVTIEARRWVEEGVEHSCSRRIMGGSGTKCRACFPGASSRSPGYMSLFFF